MPETWYSRLAFWKPHQSAPTIGSYRMVFRAPDGRRMVVNYDSDRPEDTTFEVTDSDGTVWTNERKSNA